MGEGGGPGGGLDLGGGFGRLGGSPGTFNFSILATCRVTSLLKLSQDAPRDPQEAPRAPPRLDLDGFRVATWGQIGFKITS